MVVGASGRSPFWNCNFAQPGSGIAPFVLRVCVALARDRLDGHWVNSGAVKRSIRFSESANLGFVRPIHAALSVERSLLVVDRRDSLAKSPPAKFSLLSDPDCLRDYSFILLRSQLETWHPLGARHRARAQPDSAPVVLCLDFTSRRMAKRLCLVCAVDHALRLLFILGRTAFWFALAC